MYTIRRKDCISVLITYFTSSLLELNTLPFQEHLSLKKNKLKRLHGEVASLACLRVLTARGNQIRASGIPAGLFTLEELTTLDLSRNQLKDLPDGIETAKALLVIDLSHNM